MRGSVSCPLKVVEGNIRNVLSTTRVHFALNGTWVPVFLCESFAVVASGWLRACLFEFGGRSNCWRMSVSLQTCTLSSSRLLHLFGPPFLFVDSVRFQSRFQYGVFFITPRSTKVFCFLPSYLGLLVLALMLVR